MLTLAAFQRKSFLLCLLLGTINSMLTTELVHELTRVNPFRHEATVHASLALEKKSLLNLINLNAYIGIHMIEFSNINKASFCTSSLVN